MKIIILEESPDEVGFGSFDGPGRLRRQDGSLVRRLEFNLTPDQIAGLVVVFNVVGGEDYYTIFNDLDEQIDYSYYSALHEIGWSDEVYQKPTMKYRVKIRNKNLNTGKLSPWFVFQYDNKDFIQGMRTGMSLFSLPPDQVLDYTDAVYETFDKGTNQGSPKVVTLTHDGYLFSDGYKIDYVVGSEPGLFDLNGGETPMDDKHLSAIFSQDPIELMLSLGDLEVFETREIIQGPVTTRDILRLIKQFYAQNIDWIYIETHPKFMKEIEDDFAAPIESLKKSLKNYRDLLGDHVYYEGFTYAGTNKMGYESYKLDFGS